jgi:release factor glutamine methyltransferase
MTLQTALLQGSKLLEDANILAPRLTAEVLLSHAIGCPRSWLYAHSDEELKELWWIHYGRYLHQRLSGVPTQYITGTQEFFGRDFRVTPDVLIPRPETEHVIEVALQETALQHPAAAILDIGTGSGAIAATLALETKARIVATDISRAALRVARENALRLEATVDFLECDLGSALRGNSFDLVVSNPPYVPETSRAALQRTRRLPSPHPRRRPPVETRRPPDPRTRRHLSGRGPPNARGSLARHRSHPRSRPSTSSALQFLW